jgi:hypothetical protein
MGSEVSISRQTRRLIIEECSCVCAARGEVILQVSGLDEAEGIIAVLCRMHGRYCDIEVTHRRYCCSSKKSFVGIMCGRIHLASTHSLSLPLFLFLSLATIYLSICLSMSRPHKPITRNSFSICPLSSLICKCARFLP